VNKAGKEGAAQQFSWAGCAGKVCRQGAVPLLAAQLVDMVLPGDILEMVSTRGKAGGRKSVRTQMEVRHKHSCPGLLVQGVPEPGAFAGGEQRQQLCLV